MADIDAGSEDYSQPVIAPRPQLAIHGVARHVAIIMDGNGRWANSRGLPRTEGHRAGEWALMDTVAGAIEAGVRYLSVYAFSTENWRRSPAEVRFLMGYSRDVLRRRRDELNAWNVRIVWSGRAPKLWKSVIKELREAEDLTRHNTGLTLVMCVNYGGRAEIVDAVNQLLSEDVNAVTAKTLQKRLYRPDIPDVDLLIRSSGESRLSNFLLWQAAYAELSFVPEPWPEFSRSILRRELLNFLRRERRFGGAIDAPQS